MPRGHERGECRDWYRFGQLLEAFRKECTLEQWERIDFAFAIFRAGVIANNLDDEFPSAAFLRDMAGVGDLVTVMKASVAYSVARGGDRAMALRAAGLEDRAEAANAHPS